MVFISFLLKFWKGFVQYSNCRYFFLGLVSKPTSKMAEKTKSISEFSEESALSE